VLLAATGPVKLASPGLALVGIDAAKGGYFSEKLAASMVSDELRVITAREMQALLGLERQKELVGCTSEGSSCLAELGAALGVDGILLGDLAVVGKRFELTAKVVTSTDGKVLSIRTGTAETEDELSDLVVRVAQSLAAELLPKLGRKVPERLAALSVESGGGLKGPRRFFWAPLVIGAALLVASGVVELFAQVTIGPLRDDHGVLDLARARSLTADANRLATVALGLACAGGVAVLVSAGLGVFGGPKQVTPTAWLTPDSGGFALGGVWP